MATGDLDYLRLQLAGLVNVKAFATLPTQDQNDVDAAINQAYRECYSDRDGKRPSWGVKPFAYRAPAPVTFTATLTQGATSIGSPSSAPDENFAGSYIKIGERWFTYAGKLLTVHQLVEPWPDATGTQTLIIYYNSRLLPTDFVALVEKPEVVGRGKLMPMRSRSVEVDYRSGYGDFPAEPGHGYLSHGDFGLNASMQTGEPLWHYVDATGVTPTFDARHRLCLYPLPDTSDRTISCRYAFLPALLTTGSEIPELPATCVVDILLPIAKWIFAAGNKRYAGGNLKLLESLSEQAREWLDGMRVAQRRPAMQLRSPG